MRRENAVLRNDERLEPFVLHSGSYDPGDQVDVDFATLKASGDGLHKYVVGVDVIIAGTLKQSQATAVYPVENIHALVTDYELRANGHNFTPNRLTGAQLRALGVADYALIGAEIDERDDLPNDANDHAIVQCWPFRMAPWSAKLFGDQGQVRFTVGEPATGDWDIKAQTAFTVTIIVHVLFSPRLYVTRETVVKVQPITSTQVLSNPCAGKTDVLLVTDDADIPAALTDGNIDLFVDLDNRRVLSHLTATELEYWARSQILQSLATFVVNGCWPLVLDRADNGRGMLDTSNMRRLPFGEIFTLQNCMNANVSSNSTLIRRVHSDASPEQLALWGAAFGVSVDDATWGAHARPATGTLTGRETPDEMAAVQYEWV